MHLLQPEQVIDRITMTSAERIRGLHRALQTIHEEQIPGDIVECGVWRGGNIIIAKTALDSVKQSDTDHDRLYWAFDTYEGMTPPGDQDPAPAHASWQDPVVNCLSTFDEVQANFLTWAVWDDRIRMVKGPVETTLLDPANTPNRIAILRLDTDWYASTKIELERLFARLVPTGFLIIDDYGHWSGCRQAVNEFFGEQFVQDNFEWLDNTGIMYRKLC